MEIIELVVNLYPVRIRRTEKLPPPTAMITRGFGIARKVIAVGLMDYSGGVAAGSHHSPLHLNPFPL